MHPADSSNQKCPAAASCCADLYIDPLPGYLIKCTAPLVADYIERACSITATSQPAGSDPIVALQPQHPQQPAQGQLHVVRQSQQQNQQRQREKGAASSSEEIGAAGGSRGGSSSSNDGCSGFLPGDCVPHTLLPLLHHMFLEQMPIIISTFQLLKQWAGQQQQQASSHRQQPQANAQQQQPPGARSRPRVQPPPGWLLLPRSLGMHSFQLLTPAQVLWPSQAAGHHHHMLPGGLLRLCAGTRA